MTTITLESIQATQSKLTEMIATFVAQAARTITLPPAEIKLNEGEHYAGIIVGKVGEASYHLILLPDEAESITWAKAKDWAIKARGELPNRREQALLYANLKEEFQAAWYWSCELPATGSDCAWMQYFGNGGQYYGRKGSQDRARAVRRLKIL